jgi:hypothetical protein
MSDIICEYCNRTFAENRNLKKHYDRCKEKSKSTQQQIYDQLKFQNQQQREQYEKELQQQREQYEKELQQQREQYEKQIEKIELQNRELQTQLFEIAKQPKHITTNNNTTTQTNNNRNTAIINQLAPYDLTKEQITQLFYQHFNLDTFHGGPEEIAKLTAQVILIDPETQKPKVICTDISRKNFKYVTYVDEEQEIQVDPGFQKTHDLIKEPLSKANIRMYVDKLQNNDKYHDQWRKNEDFISDRSGFSDKLVKWMV